MKPYRLTAACFILLAPALACAQTTGPADRQLTDAHGLTSKSNPDAGPIPIEDLFFTRTVRGASWSPDGRQIVLTTNLTGRENLWKVNANGGWPEQVAQSNDRQEAPVWSPDGKWIAFQQDSGGNELWDVMVVAAEGGRVINLTNTADAREEAPRWSPDGATIAINLKPKSASAYDLALLDWKTHQVKPLTHETTHNHSWNSVAWSPDGRTLYANRFEVGRTDADVYAVDVSSGTATNLTPHQGNILYLANALSPDGKQLLISSNEKHGAGNVAVLNISDQQRRWVTDTSWDARAGDFSPDGKSFTYLLNADAVVDIYLVDAATLKGRKLEIGSGVNTLPGDPSSYSPAGDRLLISHESSAQPRDLYVLDIRSDRSARLTRSAVASLAAAALPAAQVVHYKSFDGKIISALLWIPFNLKRDGSNPAIVLPHGGPTGQWNDNWSQDIAALVSHGYICIAPNVRGSTGYGIEFQRANHQDLGGGIFRTRSMPQSSSWRPAM